MQSLEFARRWEKPVRRNLVAWHAAGRSDAHACYLRGRLEPDPAQAVQLFSEAAEAEHPHAIFHLALAFQRGEGVERSWQTAGDLFKRAMAGGCVAAAYNLLLIEVFREDLAPDAALGAAWLTPRAEAGDATAQYVLARCFDLGQGGVRADGVTAMNWFERAAEQGFVWAQVELAGKLENGIGTRADPARALDLWRRAAEEQYTKQAYLPLARMLHDGRGGPRDGVQASLWARKARDEDIEGAREFLRALPEGELQRAKAMLVRCEAAGADGVGLPPAREILELAGDVLDPPDGETLPLSFALHQHAARMGSAEARFQLGHRHRIGQGTPTDLDEALRCFRAAAALGNVYAQETMAEMYESGEGLPQDPAAALQWWRRAAASGSLQARKRLGLRAGDGTLGSNFELGISLVPVAKEGDPPTLEALHGNEIGEFRLRPKPLVVALLACSLFGFVFLKVEPWIGGGLLASAVLLWKLSASWRLTVFTNAVLKRTLFGTTVVRLLPGTSIYYRTLRDPTSDSSERDCAWVRIDDGTNSIHVGWAVDQWPLLHEMLQIAEERDIGRRALHAHSLGKPITAGAFRLEAGQLHWGTSSLPMEQATYVGVRHRRLEIHGSSGCVFAAVPLVEIPNAWTFLCALESLAPLEAAALAPLLPRAVLQAP